MKLEENALRFSMINNFIISIIKIIGGFIFNLNSLFADGLQTMSDFITDIVSMIGVEIGNKKATKYHPFGFGRMEYLSNLFIGVILVLLCFFIGFNAFTSEFSIPPIKVLIVIILGLTLKFIGILVLSSANKKLNSQTLYTSIEESKTDFYSSISIIFITILLQFSDKYPILKYADMIGSLFIALIILRIGIKIILENGNLLLGETDNNEELNKDLGDLLSKYRSIKNHSVSLIKYGSYYQLELTLELDETTTLKQLSMLERNVKFDIMKHKEYKIRYININSTIKMEGINEYN